MNFCLIHFLIFWLQVLLNRSSWSTNWYQYETIAHIFDILFFCHKCKIHVACPWLLLIVAKHFSLNEFVVKTCRKCINGLNYDTKLKNSRSNSETALLPTKNVVEPKLILPFNLIYFFIIFNDVVWCMLMF